MKLRLALISVLLFMIGSQKTYSQTAEVRVKQYNLSSGRLAMEGWDPVSYFQGSPKKGSKTYSYEYEKVIYYFVSSANREIFKKNPTKYEPAYGGWCAYAMGNSGEKVEVDPETYKIFDGKLYLFYNAYFNNTKNSWNKDETNLKKKADANWKKFIK
ncbi:MAG: YHS domain protein [Bacteroidetes bacterium]|nr:YHS domain protein [Bacteroidota bacterium]